MDQVTEGHDKDILEMKNKVEKMWTTNLSKRGRRTMATDDTPGHSLIGDNVGK